MSTENPYLSPDFSADPTQYSAQSPNGSLYTYKSLTGLTWWARISLWLTAVSVLVFSLTDLIANFTVAGYREGEFDLDNGTILFLVVLLALSALGIVFLMLSNIIAIPMWMYRANANVRALGTQGVTYTPGWTAGYWFIPFLNLIRPFQAMKEIYQASAADPTATTHDAWKLPDAPSYIGIWWGTWIIGNILARVESRMVDSEMVELPLLATVSVVGTILTIVSALLAAKIIGTVNQLQIKRVNSGVVNQWNE
ncbi:hypothetical protein FF011L_25160 [Roseimaritima multifibrata]|uniref:DUF4328 domain-containing protein n=1 Tax=Roseimaritima multifibrata TaxID=1930274 RepID=A0A517MFT3_9BACT|nr:DUF4328 domain-containing protein [Roseimaritima multifibrata]QDS93743.1 hypothetical protein FF011L_25160 [Roseimaritima multifibrata]